MKINRLCICLAIIAATCCCSPKIDNPEDNTGSLEDGLPASAILRNVSLTTDKAAYKPRENVTFTMDRNQKGLAVRYWHLGDVIESKLLGEEQSWIWTPPSADFQGYYAEVIGKNADGEIRTVGVCAVDVSSDWTRFPRYGFLSGFGDVAASKRASVLDNLKNHHINGLQYYDWMYDHHHPLAGTPEKPDSDWPNLIGNVWYLETVRSYILEARQRGIASMFYDLCYGVMEWAEDDGVSRTWAQFTDRSHNSIDYHPLNPPFRSSIYLVDPANPGWLDYFSKQVSDVYTVFDFDGFHIDQLGGRGTRYDYDGKAIDLQKGYGTFINRMKADEPTRKIAFNAVGNYGQSNIASAASDFLYTEVWSTSYTDLSGTLNTNHSLAPQKNSVLAAYMNYHSTGEFNTPSVLLTDAVIMALGGDHLELGEHMLSSEYFPSSDEKMSPDLQKNLLNYYNFLTGYENLLRDGWVESDINVSSNDVSLAKWGPEKGKVVYLTRKVGDRIVIHLLNFASASHLDWRDDSKTQTEPALLSDFDISLRTSRQVSKVWTASPDINGGAPCEVAYKSSDIKISVSVPSLKYWTMIVIE